MKFLKDFGAIVAIVLASLGCAVGYGMLKSDVAEAKATIPQVNQNSTDIAVLKQGMNDIKESLNRIEDNLGTKNNGR